MGCDPSPQNLGCRSRHRIGDRYHEQRTNRLDRSWHDGRYVTISVYNRTGSVTEDFHKKAGPLAKKIVPTQSLEEFVQSLEKPRSIILMVPAGDVVDAQIAALRPLLDDDDLIIDAGNANYNDTERRAAQASAAGVPFLGIGVSGGAEGARFGPSIMGGGKKEGWDRVSDVLTAISAKYGDVACATWMGQGGAGHFVKTVHNGIEYADMQMISEAYGIMRDGLGMDAKAIGAIFAKWNEGPLKSYLIDISAKVAVEDDAETGNRAGQKGTGRWTAVEAQHLAAPIPVIDAAVTARNLSARLDQRREGEELFGAAPQKLPENSVTIDMLENALIGGKIMCYAQGFELLTAASREKGWDLPMPEVAKVWREGCIIRSAMLNDMADALSEDTERNLMFAPLRIVLLRYYAHGALYSEYDSSPA